MAIPSTSALDYYVGTALKDTNWKTNFDQIVDWLSDGLADLEVHSVDMGGNLTVGGTADIASTLTAAALSGIISGNVAYGTFTKSMTSGGTSVITGVGFQPGKVLLLACYEGQNMWSLGMDNGTTPMVFYNTYATTTDHYAIDVTRSVLIVYGVSWMYSGKISVLGSDGFSIDWTLSGNEGGSGNLHCIYLAIK